MLSRLTSLPILLVLPAAATTIYSNFSAGDTFTQNSGFSIGNSTGTVRAWAQQFTPSGASFTLDEVELAFDAPFNPAHNELTVTVTGSDVNGLPGTILESFDIVNALGQNVIVAGISSAHPLLLDGTAYWVTAAFTNPASFTDQALWNRSNNNSAAFSASASELNGGAWASSGQTTLMAAFRVSGSAEQVPEPATVGLFGLGLIALALFAIGRGRWAVQRHGLSAPQTNPAPTRLLS